MLRILPQSWQGAVTAGLRRALPGSCALCGDDCMELLCARCRNDLPHTAPNSCPQCAEPTTHGERCGRCLQKPPAFDAVVAAHLYAFPLDRLIQACKYGGDAAIASHLGHLLADKLQHLHFDRILPVPLHPGRLAWRGFNQALEIARPIARRKDTPLDFKLLVRERETAPQADLPEKDRPGNIRAAFAVRGELSGESLLLVDDVLTTGATAGECARVLKLHGAKAVTVAVVARAERR